jgi:hypothetical protein
MVNERAMENSCPVLNSSVRALAATPRRSGGTDPITALVLGELKRPLPTPASTRPTARSG